MLQITQLRSATPALDAQNLLPLMTHSSPSSRARVATVLPSLVTFSMSQADSGSLMLKQPALSSLPVKAGANSSSTAVPQALASGVGAIR